MKHPIIGITLGDFNGIGPEVIIKTLTDARILKAGSFIIYGSTKVLSYYSKNYKIDSFSFTKISSPAQLNAKKVNVINCWEEAVDIKAGEVTPEAGKSAYLSIDRAARDLKEGLLDAIVTAPINKKNIQGDDFTFVGHTEFFSSTFDSEDNLMMMVSSNLKVGVVTAHIPLREVAQNINSEKVEAKISVMAKSLRRDFGILKPRIAVLGLNPHAGEDGMLGTEEEETITPVLKDFRKKGHLVYGPFSSDGFFGSGQFRKYDGILAMYHDQGLIPFKTLAFESGINYTAGLPVIRTSPDHGTAYDIAGKNQADPTSFRESIFLASDIYKVRQETANPNPIEEVSST